MDKKAYFESNPTADELYFTSDGQAFYDANAANAHAQRLKNRHVEYVTREESEADEKEAKAAEAKAKVDREAAKEAAEARAKAEKEAAEKAANEDTEAMTKAEAADKAKADKKKTKPQKSEE